MAATELSSQDYIQHHLVHLNSVGEAQTAVSDFGIINYDSLFWSIAMGLIVIYFLWRAARSVTAGVPGRFQMSVEMLVGWVEDQTKDIVPNEKSRLFVAPLGLTIFLWITLMNTLDLLPVDLLPWLFSTSGLGTEYGDPLYYHRILPTADLNVPMGMSIAVLLISWYYGIKLKNPLGFLKELFSMPFSARGPALILLAPFNLLLNIIEYAAKTVSLGMRLFGNMFAGELVFMLIALMGAAWTGFNVASLGLGIGHILAGAVWAIFHILIVLLQAFIFMMLALVYIGQAHESH